MRVQELVGKKIAEARGDMPQAALGEQVAKYLGKGWASKHAVSQAENGNRPLGVDQLLAFALVLGKPLEFFFAARSSEVVEIGGTPVPFEDLATVLVTVWDIESAELAEAIERAQGVTDQLNEIALKIGTARIARVSGRTPGQILADAFGLDPELESQPTETAPTEPTEKGTE